MEVLMRTTMFRLGEVAERLGVSQATVYRMVTEGRLPSVKVGKGWRVPADMLDRYIAERTTEAPAYVRG
jgi:excisionase family DNA binding protein